MNTILAWIRRFWERGESDEVTHGEQKQEWEQLEGVHDDGGIPESAEHPLP